MLFTQGIFVVGRKTRVNVSVILFLGYFSIFIGMGWQIQFIMYFMPRPFGWEYKYLDHVLLNICSLAFCKKCLGYSKCLDPTHWESFGKILYVSQKFPFISQNGRIIRPFWGKKMESFGKHAKFSHDFSQCRETVWKRCGR